MGFKGFKVTKIRDEFDVNIAYVKSLIHAYTVSVSKSLLKSLVESSPLCYKQLGRR